MTPEARLSAAIEILDQILEGEAAEAALLRWSRKSRFAGSGDRAAVRDLVFDTLRRKQSRAELGGAATGRGLILGGLREAGEDPTRWFTGEGHAPPQLTDTEKAAGAAMSADWDLPAWILPLWKAALGQDAEAVALAMRDRAPVWLRVNAGKINADRAIHALAAAGIHAERSTESDTALFVTEGARKIAGSEAYRSGLIELQDLSPQLACLRLPESRTVLDYCAGGGGKALALAARGASVTAHDIDAGRMADLPARARRAGIRVDRAEPGKVSGQFDLAVADVPCSGSGTWRRTPDAKWRLTPADLTRLQGIQSDILDTVARHVKPGGYLAYMTCSVLREENEAQVAAFLDRAPQFRMVDSQRYSPLTASDGFFLALLQRS